MASIRKIKKLLSRYPVLIEIHFDSELPNDAVHVACQNLKRQMGNRAIICAFRKPTVPNSVIKFDDTISEKLSREEISKLFDSLKELASHANKPILVGEQNVEITQLKPEPNIYIHTVAPLTKNQYQELLQRVESDTQKILI